MLIPSRLEFDGVSSSMDAITSNSRSKPACGTSRKGICEEPSPRPLGFSSFVCPRRLVPSKPSRWMRRGVLCLSSRKFSILIQHPTKTQVQKPIRGLAKWFVTRHGAVVPHLCVRRSACLRTHGCFRTGTYPNSTLSGTSWHPSFCREESASDMHCRFKSRFQRSLY